MINAPEIAINTPMISNLFSRSFKNTKLNVSTNTGEILPKKEAIAGLGMVCIDLKK